MRLPLKLTAQSVAVALWATRRECVKRMGPALPTGKRLQPSSECSHFGSDSDRVLRVPDKGGHSARGPPQHARKNPAILEAKAGLEQAAGKRLVFRSIVWPDFDVLVPAGLQYGHRAGESGAKGFAVGRGNLEQTLFNMAVPPSLRRGDIEVLIAQQQLNVAVVEQLHAARLAFYAALYNRSLESIRDEQRQKLEENVATQKNRFEAGLADRSAFTSATVQADELVPQMKPRTAPIGKRN